MRTVKRAGVVGLAALALGLALASAAVAQSVNGVVVCPGGSTAVQVNKTVTSSGDVAIVPPLSFVAKTGMAVTGSWSSGTGTWRLVNNTGGASDPIAAGAPPSNNPPPFDVNNGGTMFISVASVGPVTVIGFCYTLSSYPVLPQSATPPPLPSPPIVPPSPLIGQAAPAPAATTTTAPTNTPTIPTKVEGIQLAAAPAVAVKGNQITAPVAFTGFNSGALVRLGAALAVLGAALVLVVRRRRRSA